EQRVARRQHHSLHAAASLAQPADDRLQVGADDDAFAGPFGEEFEVPPAAGQHARGGDVGAGLGRQSGRPVVPNADDDQGMPLHRGPSRASTSRELTAAAATALPPLPPRTASTGAPSASASPLLSATDTNPTGMAKTSR